MKYSELISTLEKSFEFFNSKFTNNELPGPVITILPAGRKPYLGWFLGRSWKSKEDLLSEINISAETLSRPVEEVFETLLHEMVHHHCFSKDIKNCNKQGYHNRKFKDNCTRFGIEAYQKHKRWGWGITRLTDVGKLAIKEFCDIHSIAADYFSMGRKSPVSSGGYTPKTVLVSISRETLPALESLSKNFKNRREALDNLIEDAHSNLQV